MLKFVGRLLTNEITGRPQANKPSWHEPWRTRWSRRTSWSWWPIRRLRRSSHARRLWWPPWWLLTQRWRLPRRLPWRPWRPRRLQPLLSDDQRKQKSEQRVRFEAVACRQHAVSFHVGHRSPMAGRQQQRQPRVCSQGRGYETRSVLFSTTTTFHACAIAFKRRER